MSSTHSRRRTVFMVIAAIVALILIFLLIRGCVVRRREAIRDRAATTNVTTNGLQQGQTGAASGSSGQPGGTAAQSGGTAAQSGGTDGQTGTDSGGQAGEEQQNQLAPQEEPPEQSGDGGIIPVEESPGLIEIVEQQVTPYKSTPGHDMAFVAKINGNAANVTMSIADTSGGGGVFTVQLSPGPTTNGITTWGYDGFSPSTPGTYSYSTTAVAADGRSVTETGGNIIVQ